MGNRSSLVRRRWEVPKGRPVLFRDFAEFFTRHRQKVGFADAHQCFEERRGVLSAEPEGPPRESQDSISTQ